MASPSGRPLEPTLRHMLHTARTIAAQDRIIVNRLSLRSQLAGANWLPPIEAALQPVTLTLTAHVDTAPAGLTDQLEYSLNYMELAERAETTVERGGQWKGLAQMAEAIAEDALEGTKEAAVPPSAVTVVLQQHEGSLHADGLAVEVTRPRTEARPDRYRVEGMRLSVVIGELEVERTPAQPIVVDLGVEVRYGQLNLRELDAVVQDHIMPYQPRLIERLCETTAATVFAAFDNVDAIDLRIAKPRAHRFTKSMDVAVRRTRADMPPIESTTSARHRVAVIALGSNMGDRADYLWRAVNALRIDKATSVLETGFLYESEPMYVVDQQPFLNSVVKVETTRSPEELLSLCKAIETDLGRVKVVDKGPRVVDLDVIIYDGLVHQSDTLHGPLTIPHAALSEREFVLRPLVDIMPKWRHPVLQLSTERMLRDVMAKQLDLSQLRRVYPLRNDDATKTTTIIDLDGPTQLMSILNTTPDSFSDGGDHTSLSTALAAVHSHNAAGADLIDIGGASTRPHATVPTVSEEHARVVPLVEAIRASGSTIPLSVDTYTPEVARKAVEAGCNLINDVTAGAHSSDAIFDVAVDLRCPVCLMHTRGTSETMVDLTAYDETQGGVVSVAAAELAERVEAAMKRGIPRWAILVDPGIGFAKDVEGNLELLRRLADFTAPRSPLAGFPTLVGTSRKRFLGSLTGRDVAKERVHATGATVVAAIAGGASLVRCHDVAEMRDVCRVADAIYRPHLRHKV